MQSDTRDSGRRPYWLLEWLDAEGVADPEVALGVLATRKGWQRFVAAAEAEFDRPPPVGRLKNALLAGPTFDLSGFMSCGMASCLRREFDELVRRTWLYFDTVVVEGMSPDDPLADAGGENFDLNAPFYAAHIATALYVRDTGAEDFVTFRRRGHYCEQHLEQHASDAGLPPVAPARTRLLEELSSGGQVLPHPDDRVVGYRHPALPGVRLMEKRGRSEAELLQDAAASTARVAVARYIGKVAAARAAHAALGQLTAGSQPLIPLGDVGKDDGLSPADVAVNVALPYWEDAGAGDLLALRQIDGDEYQVFRGALRKTIEERIKALPGEDAESVAESVVDDVLRPAVAGLERKMRRSSDLLRRRSAAALVTGGAITTVGLLSFAPLTVPGLVLGVGGLLANYGDVLKDRREVELSDLHFLWRVSDRAAGLHG